MLLFSALTVHAATSDDMLVYSDRFNYGWVGNWSYTMCYATNNPVHSGSNAMAIFPAATREAWWLKSSTKVGTRIYTNLTEFQLSNRSSIQPRFTDDLRLVAIRSISSTSE